jgi:TIR domain-containing protein
MQDQSFISVFLGWSGARSLRVANALREWLPKCMPEVEPWLSGVDIRAGQGWSERLEHVLKTCDCGIFCVTPENGMAPWLNFEAGAVFARSPPTLLFPYLFDANESALSQPVSRFQAVGADRSGTLGMLQQIRAKSQAAAPNRFDELWPDLERRFTAIRRDFGAAPEAFYQLTAGTRLDYRKVVEDARQEIIITAQNMQSLLRVDPLALFDDMLERKQKLKIDIILSPPEFFLFLSRRGLTALDRDVVIAQYGDTLDALERFAGELPDHKRSRVNICFHPGVSSLSAFIRDPMIDESGLAAFVPKWATDLDPGNRIFCLVRKADNRELFNKIVGHIEMMRNPLNSMTLKRMIAHFAGIRRQGRAGWNWWRQRRELY